MKYTAETPRVALTINDVAVMAPAPYTEGHVVSANEAAVLNQTLRENLRNNFAAQMKVIIDAAGGASNVDQAGLQETFDKYVEGYEFGVRRAGGGGGRTVDPVTKAARAIAMDRVKAALRAKGHKIADVKADQLNSLVEQALTKYPAIMDEAKRQVKAQAKIGADELDLSGIGTEEGADEAQEGEGEAQA